MRKYFVYLCMFGIVSHDVIAATVRPVRTTSVNARMVNKAGKLQTRTITSRDVQSKKSVVARTAKNEMIKSLNKTAQMADYCKAQYTQCMDNFCNVLDDNQGRCSCSTNLKNYSKTETALKQATENLQDVAQQIQYIGLTKDEIETLFTQTEAELTMQSTTDNSQMKNDLDRIKNMIVDVKSGTASVTDTGMSFDLSGLLDFSISSTGFDLGSLFGTNNTSTSSISNQRGEQLYKTAASRCKAAVLNSCANQGVDISIITNSYDMEIDKQCIAYERSLSDANDQMVSTVRNAKSVLQKARLMVAQQKNAYDLRGCVNALDTCMQDEFVCGSDYENCLDPSGKYIVNGEVVVGGQPYNTVPSDTDITKMLRNKIGTIDNRGRVQGMCANVMKKCQNQTIQNGQYNADNMLIKEYVARTIPRIKVRRSKVLNEYARNCLADVSACLGRNNYAGLENAAIQACLPIIRTCKNLTDGGGTNMYEVKKWLAYFMNIIIEDSGYGWLKQAMDVPKDYSADLIDYGVFDGYVAYLGYDGTIWAQASNAMVIAYKQDVGYLSLFSCNQDMASVAFANTGSKALSQFGCTNMTQDWVCSSRKWGDFDSENKMCITTDVNAVLSYVRRSYIEQVVFPSEPQDLCEYTDGSWKDGVCKCSRNWLGAVAWDERTGCSITRAGIELFCSSISMRDACVGSENFSEHMVCKSTTASDSVPITPADMLCKWDGNTGKCVAANTFCD